VGESFPEIIVGRQQQFLEIPSLFVIAAGFYFCNFKIPPLGY
jgi:hypothetical protein